MFAARPIIAMACMLAVCGAATTEESTQLAPTHPDAGIVAGRLSDRLASAPATLDISYTEIAGVTRNNEVLIYKAHFPEHAVPADRIEHLDLKRLENNITGESLPWDYDAAFVESYPQSKSVRQMTVFWQDDFKPYEAKSYRLQLTGSATARPSRPVLRTEDDGHTFTLALSGESYRIRHLPIISADGTPAELPKSAWGSLVLENTSAGFDQPSQFTILNAVRTNDPKLGKRILNFGKPRVELRENGIRTMVALFYEGTGIAVDPKTGAVSPVPTSRSCVMLEFRRDHPMVRVFTNRAFTKHNIALDGRHLYGAITIPGADPNRLRIAAARNIGLMDTDVFVDKNPAALPDEPLRDEWQNLDALLLNGGTPRTSKLNTEKKHSMIDVHVVAEEGKRCNYWFADDYAYGVPLSPDRGPVGQARVVSGGHPGYGLFLLDSLLESETNASEPYVLFEVMLDQPYHTDHSNVTRLARSAMLLPVALYDRRNYALETETPRINSHEWKPALHIRPQKRRIDVEIENAGSVALENEVIEIRIDPADPAAFLAADRVPRVTDDAGKELEADRRNDRFTVDASGRLTSFALAIRMPRLQPGRQMIRIDFDESRPRPAPLTVSETSDADGLPRHDIDTGTRRYEVGYRSDQRMVALLYAKALDTADGFAGMSPLGRVYGCVRQPMDDLAAYLPFQKNFGHQIIHLGKPTRIAVERNGMFVELVLEHDAMEMFEGIGPGVMRTLPCEIMKFATRIRFVRGRDAIECWSHRHVSHGIYNHNGFRMNSILFPATDAGVRADGDLNPAYNRPDPKNNRRWLVGMDNPKAVDTTGTQTILFRNRQGEWEIHDSSNWRGNSPFIPITKGSANHGFHLVSGLQSGPNFRKGVYFFSPEYNGYAQPYFYRDDWGYDCPFSCIFNGRASGDMAFTISQNVVQTGWGGGWIGAWMPPGNYDDHSRLHLEARYDEAAFDDYRKLTETLKQEIRVRML
jgi:hypothetical protein